MVAATTPRNILSALSDGAIRVIRYLLSKGIFAARNSGILAATGSLIVFLETLMP